MQCIFAIAKERSPTIIFIDECDALCRSRNDEDSEASARLKTQLLTEMAGFGSDSRRVTAVGNTNLPQLIDKAFQRRFEKRVYVPLPTMQERARLLNMVISQYKHKLEDHDIQNISKQIDGYLHKDYIHTESAF